MLKFIRRFLKRLSFLKTTSFYHFIQEIFFSNLIRIISKCFSNKVDNNLLILSAYGGNAFVDNTKYLYLYLLNNTKYNVLWIAKSKRLYADMRQSGYPVIRKFSLFTIKYLRKARFIFLTHGIYDILPIEFSSNTTVVLIWHGVLNKRNNTEHGPLLFGNLARFLKLHIVNDLYIDYFVTPSGTKKDKELIIHYFQINPKKIITTGFPRNDILFTEDNNLLSSLRKKYDIPESIEKVFLYAPTFRDSKLTAKLPLSKRELKELSQFLYNNHSILIMKAHMFEQSIEFKEYSNVKKVNQDVDIQELLTITNVLLTDYSSVYCDFLLLNRPILLFTYDYDEFMKKGRGFYYDYKAIAPGPLLFTGKELLNAIQNIDLIDKEYEDKRIKTRKIYHKHVDGNSTERILKYLKLI